MKKYIVTIVALLEFAMLSSNSFANDSDRMKASFRLQPSQDQCSDLLKDCFTFKDQDKNSCIKESTENIFCKGTKLTTLTKKRWSYSALLNDNQLTDKSCLDNFDNLFSAKLIQGKLSPEEINELNTNLDNCKKASPLELNRQ